MQTVRAKCVALAVAALLTASLSSTASAAFVTFDFEELAVSSGASIVSTKGGITATIKRQDGASMSVMNLSGLPGMAPSFGARTVGTFAGSAPNPAATYIINFSQTLSNASISFGDFGTDDDSPVTLTAYTGLNGGGTLLNSSSSNYPVNLNLNNGDSAVRTLTVSGAGILSLTLTSDGTFPGTLLFDNLVVSPAPTAVPEPSSLLLMGLGGLGMSGWRRWSRRAAPATAC